MRVIIDTNWFISYLINSESSQLKLLLPDTSITIITTEKQIKEFLSKVYLPKFRKYFELELALDFVKNFAKRAVVVMVKSEISICRDPKDNFFLSLSKDSGADFLITGYRGLLDLIQFENTIICTLPDLIKNHFNK